MANRKQLRQATAAEAAALNTVYARLTDLLDALRDARTKVHHEALQEIVDQEIDRQLAADDRLRNAIVEYTGRPVGEPY